ncbi:pirin isoform X3 [Nerophis lumbriciformis]|uniref:pirin isoform X3 n=1 Tax=Nerophis lumbriciformis TaxID=546530 RepID=UPI003BAC7359
MRMSLSLCLVTLLAELSWIQVCLQRETGSRESVINGSVLIVHQLQQGKHQYQVENVVQYQKSSSAKPMISRGDKLVQINGSDLQDFTPEALAQTIAEGRPMLTVHKAGAQKPLHCSEEDVLHPVSKEQTVLQFSMRMLREEDAHGGEGGGGCPVGDDDKRGGDLLVVSMTKTSISVIRGRGCEAGSACKGCHGTGCTLNDVVMVSESSTVTLVSRGSGTLKQQMTLDTPIEHVASHKYLRGICSQKTLYASANPALLSSEKMTIYYYKSTCPEPKYPVVLNFTGTDCFLRCAKKGEQVLLQVEACEKRKLKSISLKDDIIMSYVFYMKSDVTKQRQFESAVYPGWFIQVCSSDAVQVAQLPERPQPEPFLFIIQT